MKRISVLLFSLMVCAATVSAQDGAAKIEFSETIYDFGNIKESDGDATCKFVFKNTGNAPLIITRANSSCGCTAPSYPKEPVAVGDTAEISVTYHANGRPGGFVKNITVYTNTKPESYVLQIKGTVIPAVKPEAKQE